MPNYIALTLGHFRAVKAWVESAGGQALLDLLTFEVEVKARHRYFHLKPRFLANVGGRFAHVSQLTPQVTGFIGWLPYAPIRLALSTDKLAFKQHLARVGLKTPSWERGTRHGDSDFILKRSLGSFGYDLAGPFRAGSSVDAERHLSAGGLPDGEIYAEAFVAGRNLKVWCWGGSAFHAHLHDYPRMVGNGEDSVGSLIGRMLKAAGQDFATAPDRPYILGSIAYQGLALEQLLPEGQTAWVDFRYGRRFGPVEMTEDADNALPRLPPHVRAQVDDAAREMSAAFIKEVHVPVLFSLDAVLDDTGTVWWLESNSNPILPPTGYPHVLGTLFDVPVANVPAEPFAPLRPQPDAAAAPAMAHAELTA